MRSLDWLLPLTWLGALGATIAYPYLTGSSTLPEDLTRFTVRLSLIYYAAAATLMLLLRRNEWLAQCVRGRLARWCWTLSWGAYLVQLFVAFHYYHRWSHADAVAHTQEVSGFGSGIWFSHFFTAIWSADVLYWIASERVQAVTFVAEWPSARRLCDLL